MLEPYSNTLLWIVVVGFVIAFLLAFGIGANDVANSFGTSVGSKVLSIVQACCLATVFEVAGAILIGYKVTDTMRKGILDVNVYEDAEPELMLGSLSALAAAAIWLMVATFFKLPVSGTHSIVGATVGYSLVARGTAGVNWFTLAKIVVSWFVSPVLSGLTSVAILLLIKQCILRRPDPLKAGLLALPLFYGFTVLVNVFSIAHDGPRLLHMDGLHLWHTALISVGVAAMTMVVVQLVIVPWQRRRLQAYPHKNDKATSPEIISKDSTPMSLAPHLVNFSVGGCSVDTTPDTSPRCSAMVLAVTAVKHEQEMLKQNGCNGSIVAEPLKSDQSSLSSPVLNTQPPSLSNGFSPNKKPLHTIESNVDMDNAITMCSSGVCLIRGAPVSCNSDLHLQQHNLVTSVNMDVVDSSVGVATSTKAVKNGMDAPADLLSAEDAGVAKLFSFLQVLTAIFGSFAHGGNDVSNAIGPLVTLWLIFSEGTVHQVAETPIWILLYGGLGISVGLWLWGRRVIETIGEDLTAITPSTGFTIEIGAALTVLLASKIGIPISTTHCKVGSVVFVGYFNSSKKGVDWTLFRNIISAWLVTVPVAALLAAAINALLRLSL